MSRQRPYTAAIIVCLLFAWVQLTLLAVSVTHEVQQWLK